MRPLLTRMLTLTLACVIAAPCLAGEKAGEKTASRQQPQRGQTRTAPNEPVSVEAEKTALEFVHAQHPELADLLDALRRSNQPAYQAALRDVSREAERLGKLAERDSERHELSLRIWNLDSRIRLEIARLSMSSDTEVESRLRPMIEERQAARLALLEVDYQRQKDRFEKVSEQLNATRRSSSDRVSAEIDRIQRLIASRSKTRNTTSNAKPERTKPIERPKSNKPAKASSEPKQNSPAGKQSTGM